VNEPRFKTPPRDAAVWKTPLFEQYWGLKDSAPETLLFFRLGDFYELFGDDALIAAPCLELQLTSRNKNQDDPVPMCGVPAHAIDSYAEKLLAAGHKIALAEQVADDPEQSPEGKAKSKLVTRSIKRILTPGLPIDFSRLPSKEPHFFLSAAPVEGGNTSRSDGSAALDVLLFDFLASELFEGRVADADALADLVARTKPREILLPASSLKSAAFLRAWPAFGPDAEYGRLVTPWAGAQARANLLEYLTYTQRCREGESERFLPEARALHYVSGSAASDYARLPATVLEQWAVFPELFELLDKAGSAIGSRCLRQWLSRPLRSSTRIRRRQDLLESLNQHDDVLALSRHVYDFERILGRFRVGAAQPVELFRFLHSLDHVEQVLALVPVREPLWSAFFLDEELQELASLEPSVSSLLARLRATLAYEKDAAQVQTLADLVRPGFDSEFDRLKGLNDESERWLIDYEAGLREATGIASLKVRYNRVFGYYIEVTKTHLAKVPADFERKQTTVNGERFTTAVLREREREILTAASRAEASAQRILQALQTAVLEVDVILRAYVQHFAWVDAVAGVRRALEGLSVRGPWTRPEIGDGPFRLSLSESRHPILDARMSDFVPNSLELDSNSKRLLLLTGPNMAGKSTFMRQAGLCLLLAQCGLRVPARSMSFVPCSGFYSRMGATDRILSGESTFMVEMKETAFILREADASSFVLIDEIGRGTSTRDGLAIARAVLRHLNKQTGCLTIFATHYHELSVDAAALPGVYNGSMGIREWKGKLVFLRTLVLEAAASSYGIYVAKLAGLPAPLLKEAEAEFRRLHEDQGSADQQQMGLFAASAVSMPLLLPETAELPPSPFEELGRRLAEWDLDGLSPREVYARLQDELRNLEESGFNAGALRSSDEGLQPSSDHKSPRASRFDA
jgi:DNA mismatch repair protein MutS